MSKYAARIHVKVKDTSVWKKFENKDFGFGLNDLWKTNGQSYIMDSNLGIDDNELKSLVEDIADILSNDGIIIGDTNYNDYWVYYLGYDIWDCYDYDWDDEWTDDDPFLDHSSTDIKDIVAWLNCLKFGYSPKESEILKEYFSVYCYTEDGKMVLTTSEDERLNGIQKYFDKYVGEFNGCMKSGIFLDEYRENCPYDDISANYSNPIIEKLVSEYEYQIMDKSFELFDFCMCNTGFENFVCYGVSNLEKLNRTIISAIVCFGKAKDGFEKALLENEELIRNNYTRLEGYFTVLADDDELFEGADFELVDGEIKFEFRTCLGGW